MNNAEQIANSPWLEHLRGLAKLESNIGKKVAFDTCADMLEQQQAQIDELGSIHSEYLSLCLVVAAELHRIRCALEHLDENTPESINEKIRLQAIKLADTAKQLKNGDSND